jgi:hypothetical protein
MQKIRVIIKEAGKKPKAKFVENTLESFQEIVGGHIETFTLTSDLVIICNEEGKIKGLPYNCSMFGQMFVGTIVFAGVAGEDFGSVPIDEAWMHRNFPKLFE